MIAACLGLFGTALAIAAALTAAAVALAPRLGFVDRPGGRKLHTVAKPLGGGVALYVAVLLPVAAGMLVAGTALGDRLPDRLRETIDVAGMAAKWRPLFFQLLGATLLAAVGLADDRWDLRPRTKLAAQVAAGLLAAAGGTLVTIYIRNTAVQWAVTVGWIVLVTNALNLMDNMDGLCGGVCMIVSLVLLLGAVQSGQTHVGLLLATVGGAVAGFLLFNFPPARIFMGDCGSMFLGYLVATTTIQFSYLPVQDGRPLSPLYPVVLPFLLLAVPLFDMAVVVAIRFHRKRPIFTGDTNHLSHRLVALGMSHREAVLCIYLATGCIGLSAILLYYQVLTLCVAIIAVQTLAILSIVCFIEQAARRAPPREPEG
jgi:UDP-GlcNAc:undecaprenyl-phosphate GlcNAc-1-phosphate transferase